jgi:hypothetical protein
LRSDAENARELYYWVYSREPAPEELEAALKYIEKKLHSQNPTAPAPPKKAEKETSSPRREAYEDVLWALINTKEFLFNH